MTEGTLVYLVRGGQVLLAMKKRGFGEGKWNGVGGKLQPGETALEGGVRETKEEIGVTPKLNRELGLITYHDPTFGDWSVHIFRATNWDGEPVETEEMRPAWFDVTALPYDLMWPGDAHWMPRVINDHPFTATEWGDGKGGITKVELND